MKRRYLFPAAFILAISSLVLFPVRTKANIPEVNSAYREIIDSFTNNGNSPDFAIYDINWDGIDDLIIGNVSSNSVWKTYFYTLDNEGSAFLSGELDASVSLYKPVSGPGIITTFGHSGWQSVILVTFDSEKKLVKTTIIDDAYVDFSNGEDYFETDYPITWFSADIFHLPETFYGTWYIDHNSFISSDKMTRLTIHYTDDGYFHLSLDGSKYCCSFDSDFLFLADDGAGAKYYASGESSAILTVYPENPYRLVLDGCYGYHNWTFLEQ